MKKIEPEEATWEAEDKEGSIARVCLAHPNSAYGDWHWSWRYVDGSRYGGDCAESYKLARAECVARLKGKVRFRRVA